MIKRTMTALLATAVLSGCQTVPTDVQTIEHRVYKVNKDSQIQLVASDLAVELGIHGVEWHSSLRPWNYQTLRTRSISLDKQDKQAAFLFLFRDTGLLPYYDKKENRIFVEPFATNIKDTTRFEPAFNRASHQSTELRAHALEQQLAHQSLQTFSIYRDETLRDTVNRWARVGSVSSVIWYINDENQKKIVSSTMRADSDLIAKDPLHAIDTLLSSVNNQNAGRTINSQYDEDNNTLIIHGMGKSEPLEVFHIEQSDTKSNLTRLANVYQIRLVYEGEVFRVNQGYKTVITSNVQKTFDEFLTQYPMTATYNESTRTVTIRPI